MGINSVHIKFFWKPVFLATGILYISLTIRDVWEREAHPGLGPSQNFLARHILLERARLKHRADITTLNHFLPSFDVLAQFIEEPKKVDPENFQDYRRYYQQVITVFPELSEGYSMLGLCEFYLGETKEAIRHYQKAIELNPAFFWSYYDLGVILLNERRYDEAGAIFEKALATSPQDTIKIMLTSKVYQQIFAEAPFLSSSIPERLKVAYRDGYRLLLLARYLEQNKNDQSNKIQQMKGLELGLKIL